MKRRHILAVALLIFCGKLLAATAEIGVCLNPSQTVYICCPPQGGWILGQQCVSGAPTCVQDSGVLGGTNLTILQDCLNRGGSQVVYLY